ncbi:toll/interleukin-1 receptor domain-containing protein [Acinetobacter courvalinii]|uniref:toll/interleukin-1 receptor domain-containing protein n=1 Tax=Acinetobacter courvalinii TaxID=280147 RepID=UPI003F55881A
MKKIFISYSWDSEEHKLWVKKIADELESNPDFHVIWDGYDLDSSIDKNMYMEQGIHNSDYILTISTKLYQEKANSRRGGVGIETILGTARHFEAITVEKRTSFINILREKNSTPNYLKGHFYIDFTEDSKFEENMNALLNQILGTALHSRPSKKKK